MEIAQIQPGNEGSKQQATNFNFSWKFKSNDGFQEEKRQKKIESNAIKKVKERQRRSKMSQSIDQLRKLVPICQQEKKMNQSLVMSRTVEYIRYLQQRVETLEQQLGINSATNVSPPAAVPLPNKPADEPLIQLQILEQEQENLNRQKHEQQKQQEQLTLHQKELEEHRRRVSEQQQQLLNKQRELEKKQHELHEKRLQQSHQEQLIQRQQQLLLQQKNRFAVHHHPLMTAVSGEVSDVGSMSATPILSPKRIEVGPHATSLIQSLDDITLPSYLGVQDESIGLAEEWYIPSLTENIDPKASTFGLTSEQTYLFSDEFHPPS
eukprot:TRINITY_DN597_c0_g4_i1.p1 TRINITY_DN597_c0_g4~~TRINITY_DN597_c0_g4_i1.p1  ORF type:complete len:322 (-),score=54.40 TRINITY_DN597_c0_g4_i1:51-1016(-)